MVVPRHWRFLPEVIIGSAVLLLASLLRFWHLGTLLHGFHNDEVMNGYVGRFILQNGIDLYGNKWPLLYFNNFGDYPNVIPMYFSGAFTYLFGVNEFAVRFPIALMGVLTVGLVYLFARWLYRPRWVAGLAAITLAVIPWHIVLSRATAEGITAAGVFLLAVLSISYGIEHSRQKWLALGGILAAATYFLYPGFRVFTPLAFLPGILVAKNTISRRWLAIITIILFGLTLVISQTPWGKGRYKQTSIFTHNNVIGGRAINYSLGLGPNRVLEARIFHNKVVLAGREFARQYFSYFAPDFLLGQSGKPSRYVIPEHGVLLWSIPVLLGTVTVWHLWHPWNKKELLAVLRAGRERYVLWLAWMVAVAPIPAALTLDDVPNIHRSVILVVLIALLSGIAWYLLAQIRVWKKGILLIPILVLLALETIYFWHYYANLGSGATTAYRKDEQRALARWLQQNKDHYSDIYVPGSEMLPVHYLFTQHNFAPQLAQQFRLGLELDQIDNIHFSPGLCPTRYVQLADPHGVVVIDRSECPANSLYQEISRIKHLDQTDGYVLLVPASASGNLK
jgi:4-amino-4-deoxy-L-arabinose transferase-like glycosyltransferase